MVVWMDRFLAAHRPAQNLNGTIGDDLVCIHVRLRTRSGLPYHEREVVDKFEAGDLFSSLLDCLANFWIWKMNSSVSTHQSLKAVDITKAGNLHVHSSSGTLQDPERSHNWRRHPVLRLVDLEISQRPLRLRAPVLGTRHLDLAKSIALLSAHPGGVAESSRGV